LGRVDRPGFRPWLTCLLIKAFAVAVCSFCAQSATAQIDQRENAALEAWLSDRKLDDLLLDQLEGRLETTTDGKSREEIASRLANLYRKKLFSFEQNTEPLLKRTRELIAIYPRFETGRLRIAILHASYTKAEKEFREWSRAGAVNAKRSELLKSIRAVHADLTAALTALIGDAEDLVAASQLRRDRRSVDLERKELDVEILHCQFLAGWTAYFVAVLDDEQRAQLLDESETRFRDFLQLDQKSLLIDFDSRWFDFSSAWHVRAMIGLSAISIARNQNSPADHLYGLIKTNALTRQTRESVLRFRFLAHCYFQQYADALGELKKRPTRALSRDGKIRLCVSVGEVSRTEAVPADIAMDFKQFALIGLTREMAGELIVEEFDDVDLADTNTFEACWVAGYVNFWMAESGDLPAAQTAEELLQKSIKLAATSEFEQSLAVEEDVARCKYLLAWLNLKNGNAQQAIGMFNEVANELAEVDPKIASESAWLAAKAVASLSRRDKGRTNEAWTKLERFVRRWPDSNHAAEANFEKLKIELRSMPPSEAISKLERIPADSQIYPDSLSEIVVQNYRRWQASTSESASLDRLVSACNRVVADLETTPSQKLRASFLVLDAIIRVESFDRELAESVIRRCESLIAKMVDRNEVKTELQFYQMRLAQRIGDTGPAKSLARTIIDSSKNARFKLPALILIAQEQEKLLTANSKANANVLKQALEDYAELSKLLGSDVEKLKSSANARVAYARLGDLHLLSSNTIKSESVFQKLVDCFPGNAAYLRSLAASKSTNGKAEDAKLIWRKLAAGSEAGSSLWFESKFELAKMIATTDQASARKLLHQTMQLGGEMPSSLRSKFESAIRELERGGQR
jgi:tetratricopeptide (TPR) repeat protein